MAVLAAWSIMIAGLWAWYNRYQAEVSVELARSIFEKIETFALRNALDDINEYDVGQFLANQLIGVAEGIKIEGQIGVGEGDDPAGGANHRASHGATFAALPGHTHRRAAPPEFFCQ